MYKLCSWFSLEITKVPGGPHLERLAKDGDSQARLRTGRRWSSFKNRRLQGSCAPQAIVKDSGQGNALKIDVNLMHGDPEL